MEAQEVVVLQFCTMVVIIIYKVVTTVILVLPTLNESAEE